MLKDLDDVASIGIARDGLRRRPMRMVQHEPIRGEESAREEVRDERQGGESPESARRTSIA